jgi:hypothetical protein
MGYHLPGKRQGCSAEIERLVATYVDQDRKAEIDWSEVAVRNAQLKQLVTDSEAALELAMQQVEYPDVRSLGWMISKILGDDVERTSDGGCEIGKGTAPDRFISLYDDEMRHGRKSASKKFDGHKVTTCIDQASELIITLKIWLLHLAMDKTCCLPSVVSKIMLVSQLSVFWAMALMVRVKNRADCAEHPANPVDLVSPVRRPVDPEIDKSTFQIDEQTQTATCPKGHTISAKSVEIDDKKRKAFNFVLTAAFAKNVLYYLAAFAAKQPDAPSAHRSLRITCGKRIDARKLRSSSNSTACVRASKKSKRNWFRTGCAILAISEKPNVACSGSG